MTDAAWSAHLDPDRIAALGFFLGGTAVLSLAGAVLAPDALARSCAPGGGGLDCAWLEA